MKKVLIIATSPRKGGNSEQLADAFLRGAKEAGNCVEKVCLRENSVVFCRGCLACQETKRCILEDDMAEILQKMQNAEVIAFATPIYFYGMSGQMKALDRTNPLYGSNYTFRDIYLLATAADGDESAMDGAASGLMGWIACFEKTRLAGTAFGGGVTEKGTLREADAKQAYRLGRSV